MGRPVKFRDLLDAVPGSRGILGDIASSAGCAPCTVSSAMKRWPALEKAIRNERLKYFAKAESNIARLVDEGDFNASKFVLTTIGKDLGYTTKTEVSADVNGVGVVHIFLPSNGRDDDSGDVAKLED